MKYQIFLLLALFCMLPQAEARNYRTLPKGAHAVAQSAPAEMLNTLDEMNMLLLSVRSKEAADTAAPRLQKLHQQFRHQQQTAENHAMRAQELEQHMEKFSLSLDNFRLNCARLLRERCYGSTQLKTTLRSVAKSF